MINKFINFLKYNNAAVFIVLAVFLLTGGVFAQTETGQEFIGDKEVSVKGEDNTLLREVDLDKFDMDFKIGKIEKDEKYYYVTYTFLDIVKENSVWQYKMSEKQRKVPLNIEKDLGDFLAQEFKEQYDSRLADLKKEQTEQLVQGEQKRQEITEYDGLVGQTLSLLDKVFPGYEAVKVVDLPSPNPEALSLLPDVANENSSPDSLQDVYNDYINEMDPDKDDVFGSLDNCPAVANPVQIDTDNDGQGDACETDEPQAEPIVEDNLENETGIETAPAEDAIQEPETLLSEEENSQEIPEEPIGNNDTEPEVEIIEINQ